MVGFLTGAIAVLAGGSVAEQLGLIDVPWYEKDQGPTVPFLDSLVDIGEASLAMVRALIPLFIPHQHDVTKTEEKTVWIPGEPEYDVNHLTLTRTPKVDALGNPVYRPGTNQFITYTTDVKQRKLSWVAGVIDAAEYMTQIPIVQLGLLGTGALVATKLGPSFVNLLMKLRRKKIEDIVTQYMLPLAPIEEVINIESQRNQGIDQ